MKKVTSKPFSFNLSWLKLSFNYLVYMMTNKILFVCLSWLLLWIYAYIYSIFNPQKMYIFIFSYITRVFHFYFIFFITLFITPIIFSFYIFFILHVSLFSLSRPVYHKKGWMMILFSYIKHFIEFYCFSLSYLVSFTLYQLSYIILIFISLSFFSPL